MIYPNKIVLAKYLALLICISSCSVKTKSQHKLTTDNLKCNIVDIKEFDRSYRFTAIDDFGNKIIIISLKSSQQEIPIHKAVDTVSLNKSFDFKVTKIKPRVSTMEQLGAYIVIENDTLWEASAYRDIPPAYTAHNTIGLFLYLD